MPTPAIRFFSPSENAPDAKKTTPKTPRLTGSISATGKLVLPLKTVELLDIDADSARFLIGTQPGKRKINSLYLVPATDEDLNAFELVKGAKSYTIALAGILQKSGIAYQRSKFKFTLEPFVYEEGITAYELPLTSVADANPLADEPQASKRRGRKPKAEGEAE